MLYSEGIYEDMNYEIAHQQYWHGEVNSNETLREYVGFEFSQKPCDLIYAKVAEFLIDRYKTVAGAGAAPAADVPLAHTNARGEGKEEAENEKQLKQGDQLFDSAVESKGQLLQSAVHKLVDDSEGSWEEHLSSCAREARFENRCRRRRC